MSFFGGKAQTGPSQLEVAKMEAELLSETFNKYVVLLLTAL